MGHTYKDRDRRDKSESRKRQLASNEYHRIMKHRLRPHSVDTLDSIDEYEEDN